MKKENKNNFFQLATSNERASETVSLKITELTHFQKRNSENQSTARQIYFKLERVNSEFHKTSAQIVK